MRLAPVPMAAYKSLKQTYLWAAASSITTHPSLECIEACAAYGTLIVGAIQGWSKEQIISTGKQMAYVMKSSELQEVLKGAYLEKERHQISSTRYVVHTMEAALWAFTRTNDFEEGAVLAVNLAHDADTVGAVYG
ncbi:ADP-ribosylglycohydrolase family protein [Corynebacterium casei]|uniref:ADP-ribosylglycohydrolase family protein n=1 Tax=Corynebacterium casei TaxID=160386 RepID=UPI0022771F9C|nr:ADP-ribosylglycohydrolase family protein [Corynebacterium casei]